MGQKILFQTELTDFSTSDIEGVGTLRSDDKGNVYKWVENLSSDTALVAGSPVCYSDGVAAATRFLGVVETMAAGDEEMLAGVAMSAIPAGSYGWIHAKGLSVTASVTNATATPAIAIGDTLKLTSTIANSLAFAAAGTNFPNNAPAIAAEAYATASAATSAAKAVMLNCMAAG